jgi:hypothetical protein
MVMKNQHNTHTQRIRQICAFLTAGGGTLQEMHTHVNEGLQDCGLEPIGLRTLQACIEKLRQGDFDHSKKELPFKLRQKLFKVVFKHKIYTWASDTEFPEFGDLDQEERFTLPFLAGILKRFDSIPAVQKILYQLPDIFNISEDEMESQYAVFQTGPILFDPANPDFEARVIKCVIKILSHIHRGEMIEFNYTKVADYDSKIENLTMQQVAPLHIRYYEHYYYLTAADLEGKKILNFRIDQIHRLNVAAMENEQGEVVTFNRAEVEQKFGVTKKFKDALGVWIHAEKDPLHEIHIAFFKWAASYVKRLQLHASQKIVSEDKSAQTLVISLRLRLSASSEIQTPIIERNPELAFLLGRFGNYYKIVSATPVR